MTKEWVAAGCEKCGAVLQLPAERVEWETNDWDQTLAVDATGWAARNGGHELSCPFHGPSTYYLVREGVTDLLKADEPDPDYEHDTGYYVERWKEAEEQRNELAALLVKATDKLDEVPADVIRFATRWAKLGGAVQEHGRFLP